MKKFFLSIFILCAMFGSMIHHAHAQQVVMLCTQSTTPGFPPSCIPVSTSNPLPTSSH